MAVGGEDGGWEKGGGLVGEEFGFFVAGADMGEQQLFGFREGGQAGGLAGGEVLALAGQLGEVVGEGALEAEERRVAHEGHQVFAVGGVAGVGVDACGISATRHLGDAEAVGGHGMEDGEGVDGAALALKDAMEALREVHLDEIKLVTHMIARQLEGGLDDLFGPFGCHDGHGLGAAAEVHGGEQRRKAEEVVAVEVRDQYGAQRLELQMVLTDAVLGSLGAIEQEFETVDVDHLRATTAAAGGQGRSRS